MSTDADGVPGATGRRWSSTSSTMQPSSAKVMTSSSGGARPDQSFGGAEAVDHRRAEAGGDRRTHLGRAPLAGARHHHRRDPEPAGFLLAGEPRQHRRIAVEGGRLQRVELVDDVGQRLGDGHGQEPERQSEPRPRTAAPRCRWRGRASRPRPSRSAAHRVAARPSPRAARPRPRDSEPKNCTPAASSSTNTPRRPELPPEVSATYSPNGVAGSGPASAMDRSTMPRLSRRSVNTSSRSAIISALVITGSAERSRASTEARSTPRRRRAWNGECSTAYVSSERSCSCWCASISARLQPNRWISSGYAASSAVWSRSRSVGNECCGVVVVGIWPSWKWSVRDGIPRSPRAAPGRGPAGR